MDYGYSEKRNKGKKKKKDNRRFPYKSGGGKRGMNVKEGKKQ